MGRIVTYRGHEIRAHAVPLHDRDDAEWAAHAVIRVPGPTGREQPLRDPDDRTFPSEEDAERYGVHLAMGWVDRHGA
jgi:hypothetical protein